MVNGKPNLIFGQGGVSSAAELRSSAKSALGGQRPGQMSGDFASFLESESKATVFSTGLSAAAQSGQKSSVPMKTATNDAGKLLQTRGRKYSFGMENGSGLRSANAPVAQGGGRVAAGSLNRGFNPIQQPVFTPQHAIMAKALESTNSPLKTLSSMQKNNVEQSAQRALPMELNNSGSDMGISNSTPLRGQGLAIGGTSPGVLALHVDTHRKRTEVINFDYALTTGVETRNLLKAFNKIENTFKKKGIEVAEAPYKRPVPFVAKAPLLTAVKSGYNGELGSLVAKFESGDMGISAIGYDGHGGTSYGKYQISSRAGTMKSFISYLDDKAPDLALQLKNAGSANTGGRNGKMPTVWKAIAEEQPERFERLQGDFIKRSHFEPALVSLTSIAGISSEILPPALQEAVFSTAVQHGPAGAAKIIDRAIGKIGAERLRNSLASNEQGSARAEQELIYSIYEIRSRQFGSSSNRVQAAVKNRLQQELQDVLAITNNNNQA